MNSQKKRRNLRSRPRRAIWKIGSPELPILGNSAPHGFQPLEKHDVKISENPRRYAVIGHPVAHSLSPAMHNANFRANGDDAVYEREDVAPADLERFILDNPGSYSGLSVTIPHKEKLYELLTSAGLRVDAIAKCARSVNTISFVEGLPLGWSTDGYGFNAAFEESFGEKLAGKSVIVLGTGGSARAVMAEAQRAGAVSVRTAGRNLEKARQLNRDLDANGALLLDANLISNDDVVINATSVGLQGGDAALFTPSMFGGAKRQRFACDLIYAPTPTPFIEAARAAGRLTNDGLGMLLHQGVAQYKIWTGRDADVAAMRAALFAATGRKA